MQVRDANENERNLLLGGTHGYVALDGEAVVGHLGWKPVAGDIYAHSFFIFGNYPKAAAMLAQRLRSLKKDIVFEVDFTTGMSGMFKMAEKGRAVIEKVTMRMVAS